VSAEDIGSEENLFDGLELHSPWTRDFLDPVPGSGGDAQVLQQSSKPTGEDQRFSSEGFHLVSIPVHLLRFGIARGRLLFIGLVVCRAGTLEAAACSEVLADRQVDDWCSCMQCDGYEPSNI
jgi:hypothetical protein